jgi:hypothetical protein
MKPTPKWLGEAGDRVHNPPPTQGPSMLYYDIETAPQLAYQWGSGKYDTRPLKVTKPRYVLSVVYWWEGEEALGIDPHWVSLDQNPKYRPDRPWSKPRLNVDEWVIGELWHLFDRADITVAHNGKRFDTKRTNARLIVRGARPYRPVAQIDTLLEYRKLAAFPSNSLAELSRELGLEGKYHHPGLDMWWGCMEGDPSMWEQMRLYNMQDVVALRDVYKKIAAWTTPVVNAVSMARLKGFKDIGDRPVECPKPGCDGDRLISRGFKVMPSGLRYRRWQCVGTFGCGGFSQSRYAELDEHRPLIK